MSLRRGDRAPAERTLIDILRSTAETYPDEPAVDDGTTVLSYADLVKLAATHADRLRELGIGPGHRVGIRLPSGTTDLYVAILAALTAGAAYVPVDADDPEDRATLVFTEATTSATFTTSLTPTLPDSSGDERALPAPHRPTNPDPSDDEQALPAPHQHDNVGHDRPAGRVDGDRSSGGGAWRAGSADEGSGRGLDRPPEPPQGARSRRGNGGGPGADDDAWVIFTSGSTGVPKGVAVSHRSAAAFVDAEARMFLRDEPIGPEDRVLAGLSVAFDASCEEMWLAWRHGACLVPAPRSLVRTGMDLGPWLVTQGITIVSTVPTLAALWPPDALDQVRLLIFGGEACPPELAERLAVEGREVWNTYGPTEATVVACAARLTGEGPVRIGLPLDGWDLAVVDAQGNEVPPGEIGELIIGGIGLARYLDPAKDAEKFAPMPSLGWQRAYRSGDLVRNDPDGLLFIGRADEQVKLGGRRIELGEVDAALQALPGVSGAAAAVRCTPAGTQILVGYVVPTGASSPLDTSTDHQTPGEPIDGCAKPLPTGAGFDRVEAAGRLREVLPAALVPLVVAVDTLPTRTSGKVDRDALPWPLPEVADSGEGVELEGTAGWLAERWTRVLGTPITGPDDDFFTQGGGSLAAAQLVSALRERYPAITVADIYEYPRLGALADRLDAMVPTQTGEQRTVTPTPLETQLSRRHSPWSSRR